MTDWIFNRDTIRTFRFVRCAFDAQTGVAQFVYAFDDGALDDRFVSITQLVRTAPGIGGSENLSHRLDFGSVSQNTTLSYGERGSAGTYWENTGGSPSWYSHSYYAGDTT